MLGNEEQACAPPEDLSSLTDARCILLLLLFQDLLHGAGGGSA